MIVEYIRTRSASSGIRPRDTCRASAQSGVPLRRQDTITEHEIASREEWQACTSTVPAALRRS